MRSIKIGLYVSLLSIGLSGCIMKPGPKISGTGLSEAEKRSVEASVPSVDQHRSVLVVRVLRNGNNCPASGTVRITPVAGGRLDVDRSINIGHTNMGMNGKGFASFGKTFGRMAMLDISGAEREMSLQHIRTSFVSVPPGNYVVTHVRCATDSNAWSSVGGGNRTGLLPAGIGASTPVNGDNFIRVPPARIVDAGYLDARDGELIGSPIGAEAQAVLKSDYPNTYSKVLFSNFSPWSGGSH